MSKLNYKLLFIALGLLFLNNCNIEKYAEEKKNILFIRQFNTAGEG